MWWPICSGFLKNFKFKAAVVCGYNIRFFISLRLISHQFLVVRPVAEIWWCCDGGLSRWKLKNIDGWKWTMTHLTSLFSFFWQELTVIFSPKVCLAGCVFHNKNRYYKVNGFFFRWAASTRLHFCTPFSSLALSSRRLLFQSSTWSSWMSCATELTQRARHSEKERDCKLELNWRPTKWIFLFAFHFEHSSCPMHRNDRPRSDALCNRTQFSLVNERWIIIHRTRGWCERVVEPKKWIVPAAR